MEICIATSIKSFDLNPTHPGPLPRVSFHTSAINEVGDRLQKSASSEQDELTNGRQYCKGREQLRVSARKEPGNYCGNFSDIRCLFAAEADLCKEFAKQPQRLGDDFEFAFS